MENLRSAIVLIPARNEQTTIGEIVTVIKNKIGIDVVVIDDASFDNTIAEASKAGATVLPLSIHLGSWAAIQTGMIFALDKGYKQIITMDADGQHIAEAIPALLKVSVAKQAGVVIGSYPQRVSELKGFTWLFFRKLSGLKVVDLTSGFRVYSRESIKFLVSDEFLFLGYQDIGVLLLIQSQGLQIVEVEVMMNNRLVGPSRIFYSWLAIINYLLQTTIVCVSKKTKKHASLRGCFND